MLSQFLWPVEPYLLNMELYISEHGNIGILTG